MEELVGVLGLDRLLDPQNLRIQKKDIAKMVRYERDRSKMLKKFLEMDSPEKYEIPNEQVQLSDFDAILEDLDNMTIDGSFGDQLVGLDNNLALEFAAEYRRILNILETSRPATVQDGVLGAEPVEPTDAEKFDFIALCRLVNDINWLYSLMYSNALTQDEVELFEELYPESYENIMLELLRLLIENSSDNTIEVGAQWKKDIIAALAKQPSVTPETLVQLQATYGEEDPGQQPQGNDVALSASTGLTQSQRLEESD